MRLHFPLQWAVLPCLAATLLSGCRSVLQPTERTIVSIMVENHQGARPYQRGLEKALLIQEFLVEGGISRFAVSFDRADLPPQIGPVRSLRPYFIEAIEPWTSLLLFAGGSPEAFEKLTHIKHLTYDNGLAYKEFTRDLSVEPPHNLFISGSGVLILASGALLHAETWPPYPLSRLKGGTEARSIKLNFYSRTHNVTYTYEPQANTFARLNGSIISPAHPSNVLVLQSPITAVGEKGRLTIPVEGNEGPLLLFRGGTVQEGTWQKQPDQSWDLRDVQGQPLTLNPGQTWLTVLPDIRRVTWNTSPLPAGESQGEAVISSDALSSLSSSAPSADTKEAESAL